MNIFHYIITSFPGMYIVQSCLHSITAAIIVRRVLQIWKITDPVVKQRYHVPVIVIPVFSYPLYLLLNPERNGTQFRLNALFDSNRWLMMDIFGIVPVSSLFLLIVSICVMIFLFQELIPILSHLRESKNGEINGTSTEYDSLLDDSLAGLSVDIPDIVVLDDDDHVIYSATGKDPAIFFSTGLLSLLSKDEIRVAIVHEIAHIRRSRKPLLILLYVLRVIMMFNPIVLLAFRHMVHEEERICDDIAVSLTGGRQELADVLKKQYHKDNEDGEVGGGVSGMKKSLEEYSFNLDISERIQRLESGDVYNRHESGWIRYVITIVTILIVNYFVI